MNAPHVCRGLKRYKWRREQDSNLQALTGGSFQDYCITNYAISPRSWASETKIYRKSATETNEFHPRFPVTNKISPQSRGRIWQWSDQNMSETS